MPASDVWFVVPGDPGQNTGGYRYVRRLVEALRGAGTPAQLTGLEGAFPHADERARQSLNRFLTGLPDGARVVLDGLAMGGLPEVLQRHCNRLNLMALVHHPLADENGLSDQDRARFTQLETAALQNVGGVFTTSDYTAHRLQAFEVEATRITTALPAVDEAFFTGEPRVFRPDRPDAPVRLLCVGHLSPRKAQHQLLQALAQVHAQNWHCTLVGSMERDPEYAESVNRQVRALGLETRVQLAGELDEDAVLTAYQRADLFVFPSLYEGYGMVIDEALAAGLPVLSSDGGALSSTSDKPGVVLYPAGDVAGLSEHLSELIAGPSALDKLTEQAGQSRQLIRRWSETATDFRKGLDIAGARNPARFEADWLELREAADHTARADNLTRQVARWLSDRYSRRNTGGGPGEPLHLVDLGTGRGSNPVYLCRHLPVPQQWTLIEPDRSLGMAAHSRVERLDAPVALKTMALTADNLESALPAKADLVTASALIDLVSRPWLEALSAAVARRQAALLVVISYSGSFALAPTHPFDEKLRALVNAHQHSEKGSGPAMGPGATEALGHALAEKGYTLQTSDSPWKLTAEQAGLAAMLLEGWAEAARDQSPQDAERIRSWLYTRQQQLGAETLSIVVDHTDLLAWPTPN
ncbi:glycosyltransferase family 4 protein [Marinobacter sp. VGCF2001]|uniref:glycosyltransferase family 4 protein n=1 Tax=Marinobacter sp. VGCF2001 TaxID=3417189 RepID=UPI003CF3ED23